MMMDYAVEAPAADGHRTKTKNFDAEQLIRRTLVSTATKKERRCCFATQVLLHIEENRQRADGSTKILAHREALLSILQDAHLCKRLR